MNTAHPDPPILDDTRLRRLADVATADAAEQFAADYREILPARVERLTYTLSLWDTEAAMDAVLSLKTSSSMIGALRMEQICEHLEQALVMADRDNAVKAGQEAQEHLPELAAAIAARQARGPA